jgi:hypothetical protein
VTDIRLKDNSYGILIGITNRHPKLRYSASSRKHMSDGLAFHFASGAEAKAIELKFKRKYKQFAVPVGLSPIPQKLGSTGEIISGVCPNMLRSELAIASSNHDWLENW